MIDADNLVIFMSDSIRWDSHPSSIAESGLTFKTVASSLFTPPSHASMLTGLYPHNHGVSGFFEELPSSLETILDSFQNAGLSDVRGHFDDKIQGEYFNEAIYKTLLSRYDQKPLDEMNEPFGWFMRDPGGHAPYGGWDLSMNVAESVPDFFDRYAGDEEALRRRYKQGVELSVKRFEKYVIEPLESRGILDDTLVVFLSDHGEQIGDHGHCGQSIPATPEVAYVPTTFIHPDLETGRSDRLFRHIDLPKTISSLMSVKGPKNTDGVDVFSESPAWGYSLIKRTFPSIIGSFDYEVRSIWDSDGGYVHNTSPLWNKTKFTGGYLSKIPSGKQLRRKPQAEGLKLLFESYHEWGKPNFSLEFAREKLEGIEYSRSKKARGQLDESTKDHLEQMGYI
ncbi:N-acetylgalactosamine-4-sulfatase [Haloferax larsenii JCM 13917]|nr:sulfatase-like hydrolase/transferase [Haloferax larsenii]ELZ79603.1 N-acetylgalactosamine-4-sulfatase [Haloferax larsenii JCM 13917]